MDQEHEVTQPGSLLNPDGTLYIDPVSGNPVPTYSQDDINQYTKALTGWKQIARLILRARTFVYESSAACTAGIRPPQSRTVARQ